MSRKLSLMFSVIPVALTVGGCATVAHDRVRPNPWPAIPSQQQVDDTWVKLLALINKHGGYVSRDDFEKTFEMAFDSSLPNRSHGTFHIAHQGKSWILDANVEDGIFDRNGVRASYLTVQFREFPGKEAGSPCLSPEVVFNDLNRAGWQGTNNPNIHLEMHADSWTILRRKSVSGDYVARVWSYPRCVLDISVGEASVFGLASD